MANDAPEPTPKELGVFLAAERAKKQMSLREVEEATDKTVSNAYLSQLENGKISQPSPLILYRLASIYGCQYEKVMEKAGYLPAALRKDASNKHGRAATHSIDNLSAEEEKELMNYLRYMRTTRKLPSDKTR